MRGVVCSLAIALVFAACAQLYAPASKNPALVRVPVSRAFGVGDQINLVEIDGVSVDATVKDRNYWRIDPRVRRLTIAYEASNKIVGARVAASLLVLDAKLAAGIKYDVVCESSDLGVKAFLRQESTGRIVSNVAESQLISAPATYPSPPTPFQIPVGRRD
ncbi:MAG TPA: hypothetical protein VNX27_08585 [Chthoniobacterales bacterium]|jgi:hypothetical protein|nr:hypothetical protein [Chthoniobacterales bacterium]